MEEGNVLFVSHGGLYAAILPRVLSNIEPGLADVHPIEPAAYVLAERTDRGLVATEWSGLEMRT